MKDNQEPYTLLGGQRWSTQCRFSIKWQLHCQHQSADNLCVLRLWPQAKYSHSNDLLKHHRDPTQVNTEAATSSAQCQWFLWAHHSNPLFGLVIRLVMTCDPPSQEETAWQRLWKERGSVLCVGSRSWWASWNCYSLLVPTQSANNETAM